MAIFSKRHHEALARSLRLSAPTKPKESIPFLRILDRIASDLQDDNSKFDRAKFVNAVVEGEIP